MRGGVTDAGQTTTKQTLKIELLSLWKLKVEFGKFWELKGKSIGQQSRDCDNSSKRGTARSGILEASKHLSIVIKEVLKWIFIFIYIYSKLPAKS